MRTVFRVILIINHRAGRGAAAARGGGAARRRAARSGAARPSVLNGPASWSLSRRNGSAALDSRGCLPHDAARAGGGGETSCSSRNGSSPLLARSAKQGGGRAIFASKRPRRNRRRRATRSRRPDCPGRECVPPRRGYSGTVPTGRGSRDDSRESTAGIRGVGLASEKSGMALPATLLLTRAPHRHCGGRAAAARLPSS